MSERVVIEHVTIEDFKRIREASYDVPHSGLYRIGGKNRQGKTTNLDAIAAALGGESFVPDRAVRTGARKGRVEVKLSNGMVARRTFTAAGGGTLTVDSPVVIPGGPQQILNKIISTFALDLNQWLQAKGPQQLKILLKLVGVDFTLLDIKRADIYTKRTGAGQAADRAKGHYESMPFHEDAGEVQGAAGLNAELAAVNTQKEDAAGYDRDIANLKAQHGRAKDAVTAAHDRVIELERQLATAKSKRAELQDAAAAISKEVQEAEAIERPTIRDSAPILAKLEALEESNGKARANAEKKKAEEDWKTMAGEYASMTQQIDAIDAEKLDTLNGAAWPLKALSVEADKVCYNGVPWDQTAHSDQLIAATAICAAMNPKMGFVLIDGLEAMDLDTLERYHAWLVKKEIQAIGTRVSTGPENSIVFENGEIKLDAPAVPVAGPAAIAEP